MGTTRDIPDTTGYDTQNLYNGSGEYLHPDTSGYGYALVNPNEARLNKAAWIFHCLALARAIKSVAASGRLRSLCSL